MQARNPLAHLRWPGGWLFRPVAIYEQASTLVYSLCRRDLSSPVTQAHIHFGRPATSGAIVLFLCNTSAAPPPAPAPTPPLCRPAPATVTGTLTMANVIARPDQGIDPGAAGFAEMLEAIRAGAAYANVHTTSHPSGEIRARLHTHGRNDG
jgi:CHRD domain-containing protein